MKIFIFLQNETPGRSRGLRVSVLSTRSQMTCERRGGQGGVLRVGRSSYRSRGLPLLPWRDQSYSSWAACLRDGWVARGAPASCTPWVSLLGGFDYFTALLEFLETDCAVRQVAIFL